MDNEKRILMYKEKFLELFTQEQLAEMVSWTMIEGGLSDHQMIELLRDWTEITLMRIKEKERLQ